VTGIMTGKWERVRLGDVCDIAAGQGAPQGDENYCKIGGTPFIKAGNLECLVNGVSLKSIQAVGDEIAHSHKLRLYPKGTIVFAKSGMSCVKEYVYELEDDCYVVNHLACILPNKMDATYIKYYFRATPPSRLIKDFGYPSIRLTDIANIILSVPDVKTQKRIADVLDKASELIKKRKEQIRLMDQLPKSLFIEMFGDPVENPMGWDVKPFTTAAIIDTNMTTDFEKYANYPHIGIESIERDSGRILNYNLVKDDHLSSGKYTFGKQHIIYSKIRPNLNKVALPNFDGLCSADAYPILPKDTANKFYLAYILRSKHFLDYILKHSDRTNIPKANKKQLEGYKLPLPPISLQNEFADRIDAIEQQKALLQDGLAKMETAYKALMQEYFG